MLIDAALTNQIIAQGFCLLPAAVDAAAVERLRARCRQDLSTADEGLSARSSRGHVYAARNVIELVPEVLTVWRSGIMHTMLGEVLGDSFGLVRVLFFDKPPDRTWALPWHKDMSIAVEDNTLPSLHFSRPTLKAGVPHVIASDDVLRQMLTMRLHLDDVTEENGPLRVIPQSHLASDAVGLGPDAAVTIHAQAGDVLAMRPLIDHCSGPSLAGTSRHRRILHLEFAAHRTLPDGFSWYRFIANV